MDPKVRRYRQLQGHGVDNGSFNKSYDHLDLAKPLLADKFDSPLGTAEIQRFVHFAGPGAGFLYVQAGSGVLKDNAHGFY